MAERKEMDKCPYCGSDDLDYTDNEYETDWDWNNQTTAVSVSRDIVCCKCGKRFRQLESYGLKGYIIQNEDGEDIYFE